MRQRQRCSDVKVKELTIILLYVEYFSFYIVQPFHRDWCHKSPPTIPSFYGMWHLQYVQSKLAKWRTSLNAKMNINSHVIVDLPIFHIHQKTKTAKIRVGTSILPLITWLAHHIVHPNPDSLRCPRPPPPCWLIPRVWFPRSLVSLPRVSWWHRLIISTKKWVTFLLFYWWTIIVQCL